MAREVPHACEVGRGRWQTARSRIVIPHDLDRQDDREMVRVVPLEVRFLNVLVVQIILPDHGQRGSGKLRLILRHKRAV